MVVLKKEYFVVDAQIQIINESIIALSKGNASPEERFFQMEELTDSKARLCHEKIRLAFPQADAVYEDKILSLCDEETLYKMKRLGLIESCGVISGRRLYAL